MFMLSILCGMAYADSYVRADVGMTKLLRAHPSPFTAPVSSHEFTFGHQIGFVGVEVSYRTDVWNGAAYDLQPGNLAPSSYFQGDTRLHALTAGLRKGFHVGQKWEMGGRVNVGVAGMPILMDEDVFNSRVVQESWGANSSPNHGKVYTPVLVGGYADVYRFYETLAVGFNVDYLYMIGWDTGLRYSLSLNSRF